MKNKMYNEKHACIAGRGRKRGAEGGRALVPGTFHAHNVARRADAVVDGNVSICSSRPGKKQKKYVVLYNSIH